MTDNLTIKDTDETFESWVNKDFIPDSLRPDLLRASILLVPTIGFREENELTFPVLTEDILNYFKEKLPNDIVAEICIDDAQYLELALHSDYKRIGNFVVKSIAVPIFATILSAYIYDKYVKPEQEEPQIKVVNIDNSTHTTLVNPAPQTPPTVPKKYLEPTKVQFSVTVVDSNKISKEFKYEGQAKDVKVVVDDIQKLWNNDTTTNRE